MNHGPNGVTQLLRDVISHSKPGEEGEQASLEVLSSLSEPAFPRRTGALDTNQSAANYRVCCQVIPPPARLPQAYADK